MSSLNQTTLANRFDNMSDAQIADEIGRVDAIMKAAEAEAKALKDEFKARKEAAKKDEFSVMGDSYTVTASDQLGERLDQKAVIEFLGPIAKRFMKCSITTVVRIKPNARKLSVAA